MAQVRFTEASLARVNVDLLDGSCVRLGCKRCGAQWSPNLRAGGHLPRGWWKCPNGCNSDKHKEHTQ